MRIEVKNDLTRALEEVEGSGGRMNVSSRSDSRAYYTSRDTGRCFSAVFEMAAAEAGEYFLYVQNTSTSRVLVVHAARLSASAAATLKGHFATGTASGDPLTAVNMNRQSSHDAEATVIEGAANPTGITGLASLGEWGVSRIEAGTSLGLLGSDLIRLGEGDAIAFSVAAGTAVDIEGTIVFYFEAER